MVNLGKLAKTMKKVVDSKGDKIAAGVEKATGFVDKKTKGKFHDKLEKVDGLAEKLDKTGDRPAGDAAADTAAADTAAADTAAADTAAAEASTADAPEADEPTSPPKSA